MTDRYSPARLSPKAAFKGEIEQGQPIVEGHCPCCGAALRIEHGDDDGEVAFLGTAANRMKINAYNRAYYAANRDKIRAQRNAC